MVCHIYWKLKQPADNRLPDSLRRALEKYGKKTPSTDFLYGFLDALTDEEEKLQVGRLLEAMLEKGSDQIEIEWQY